MLAKATDDQFNHNASTNEYNRLLCSAQQKGELAEETSASYLRKLLNRVEQDTLR